WSALVGLIASPLSWTQGTDVVLAGGTHDRAGLDALDGHIRRREGADHFCGREHRFPLAGTRSLRAAQSCLTAIKTRSPSSTRTYCQPDSDARRYQTMLPI